MINKRKPTRLKDFDYSSPEDYFITICSRNRECIFGEVGDGEIILNKLGAITEQCLLELTKYFSNIQIDIYSIMPNHIHFILSVLCEENNYRDRRGLINQTPTKERDDRWIMMRNKKLTVGKIVRSFKAKTTFLAHQKNLNMKWQRGYYEEIIRDEKHYNEIYTYIESNSQIWDRDKNNPKNL